MQIALEILKLFGGMALLLWAAYYIVGWFEARKANMPKRFLELGVSEPEDVLENLYGQIAVDPETRRVIIHYGKTLPPQYLDPAIIREWWIGSPADKNLVFSLLRPIGEMSSRVGGSMATMGDNEELLIWLNDPPGKKLFFPLNKFDREQIKRWTDRMMEMCPDKSKP